MNEFESPMTPEQQRDINVRGDELIAEWAAWERDNWPSRFIESEDEEEQHGKIEQLHRTAVMALAQVRQAQASQAEARALNEQFNPTEHLKMKKEF